MGDGKRTLRGLASRRRPMGFTLIEVLVVVAIIALLISILLPSLKKARDQARSAACAAQVGQICRAESAYQNTNREWIPGSPLTTGYYWAANFGGNNSPPWHYLKTRFAVEWWDYATPLRVMIQGPSSIPKAASGVDATAARSKLFRQLTEDVFHCPANPHYATLWSAAGGTGPGSIRAPSYLTMSGLMKGGPAIYDQTGSGIGKLYPLPDGSKTDIALSGEETRRVPEVVPPVSYVPRHSRLGRESMKVFVADGLRFYDPQENPPITYSTTSNGYHGILGAATPAKRAADDPTWSREYVVAKAYSYRHGSNNRINAGFFDGHVESLWVDYSKDPFTGSAVKPMYYYPSGSWVNVPEYLHVPMQQGSSLP